MRRIMLVLALVALLVIAAVVPAVADPSPTGIVPNLAKAIFPGDILPVSWGGSSDDATTDGSDSGSNENSDQASLNTDGSDGEEASLNADDSEASLSASDSDSENSGSSSSGSSISQEFESEDIESGEASPSVSISNTGDNANLCAAVQQSANTGNVSNQQGVNQYGSETDDIEFEGSSITITPELVSECTQTTEQSGAAGT